MLKLAFQLSSLREWSEACTFFSASVYLIPGAQPLVGVSRTFLDWMTVVKAAAGVSAGLTDLGSIFWLKLTTTGSFRRT